MYNLTLKMKSEIELVQYKLRILYKGEYSSLMEIV